MAGGNGVKLGGKTKRREMGCVRASTEDLLMMCVMSRRDCMYAVKGQPGQEVGEANEK